MATQLKNDALPKKIRSAIEVAEWTANGGWEYFSALTESPIEQLLLIEMFADFIQGHTTSFYMLNCYAHGAQRHLSCHGILCYPQVNIGYFRVDFLLDVLMPDEERKLYAIECDGHDYHDRTKEQAQRDKARDRFLVSEGVTVLRYTGSEIFRDPETVWREIIDIVTDKRGPKWAHPTRMGADNGKD